MLNKADNVKRCHFKTSNLRDCIGGSIRSSISSGGIYKGCLITHLCRPISWRKFHITLAETETERDRERDRETETERERDREREREREREGGKERVDQD